MLTISGLSISYGPVQVVHGVTMDVDEGQIVALIGPNGAGKSSVLRAVSGLIRPKAGDITFLGASLVGAPAHEIALAGIAHVMEGRHLFGGLSVEDNLILAGSRDEKGSAGNLESVYQRWPRLRERREQLSGTLSGGEQQMLAIGRALISRPRLMILDEPSWGLAPRIVRELMDTFVKLRQGGMTILLCEQMANLALKICDYAYVMTGGKIVLEGPSQKLLSDPDLQATYLGGNMGEAVSAPSKSLQAALATDSIGEQKSTGRRGVAKTVEPVLVKRPQVNRAAREKVRGERVRQLPIETGTLGHLLSKPEAWANEDRRRDEHAARERRRKIRAREFEGEIRAIDMKQELTNLRKEISRLGAPLPRIEPAKEAVLRPSEPTGPDRRALEAIRKRQQREVLSPPLASVPTAPEELALEKEKSKAAREQLRREREAAARRELRLQEADPDHKADRDRQKRSAGAVDKKSKWSQEDRKRMEERRQLRQSSRDSQSAKQKPAGKSDRQNKSPVNSDRKLKELQRRQKQTRGAGFDGQS